MTSMRYNPILPPGLLGSGVHAFSTSHLNTVGGPVISGHSSILKTPPSSYLLLSLRPPDARVVQEILLLEQNSDIALSFTYNN